MDPALTDRTSRPILGVSHTEQPVRPMSISGIERSIHAKILSSTFHGAGTRIVRLEAGWGSRLAGAFTADVELFVLKGDVSVGSVHLTDYEYILIPSGGVVGGFRTEAGAVVLMMTSGPVRYDTASGGAAAALVHGRPGEAEWERESEDLDLFVRPLAMKDRRQVWLGSSHLSPEHDMWHQHPHDEETFVLEGAFSCRDLTNKDTVATSASAGSYFYRPAGSKHTAPVPLQEETVLTFHRSIGAHTTELVDHKSSGE